MKGFLVNLDFSVYYEDLRKYACIFVDSTKCKIVGDVLNHIKTVFNLDGICLTNDKFLMPWNENVYILEQDLIFKVQKCDFYGNQIHENNRSNSSCNQHDLNQFNKTIDLSSTPRQGHQVNNSENQIALESTPIIEYNEIGNRFHPSEILFNGDDEIETKCRMKTKKKKNVNCSNELKINNDESIASSLDVSVTEPKKMLENKRVTLLESNELPVYKYSKKCKKRKKSAQTEELVQNYVTDTCFENLATGHKIFEKQEMKPNYSNSEFNEDVAKDLRFCVPNNEPEKDIEQNMQNMFTSEDSAIRKKNKRKNQSYEFYNDTTIESEDINTNSVTPNIQTFTETYNAKLNNLQNESASVSTKTFKESKKDLIEFCDRLLNATGPETSCSRKEVLENEKLTSPVTQCDSKCIQINGKQLFDEDNSLEPIGTEFKRKRKRRHNKKKKTVLFNNDLGFVLEKVIRAPEVKSSPTASDLAKHTFFTDDDFKEEMDIPTTPLVNNQPISQGDYKNDASQTQDKYNLCLVTSKDSDDTTVSWQQKLIKLATISSQAVVFHRNLPSAASDISMPDSTIKDSHKKINANNGNGENAQNSEEFDKSVNATKHDLTTVVLKDYPVVSNVLPDDIILFKILKLSETLEPTLSNLILAKVKDSANFPHKISLQILEGFEECDSLEISNCDKCCFIVELQWSAIIEPRLFYP